MKQFKLDEQGCATECTWEEWVETFPDARRRVGYGWRDKHRYLVTTSFVGLETDDKKVFYETVMCRPRYGLEARITETRADAKAAHLSACAELGIREPGWYEEL